MSIKVAFTVDGTVAREIFPSGERSYKLGTDGWWYACGDHKGPWVRTPRTEVPERFKEAVYEAHVAHETD